MRCCAAGKRKGECNYDRKEKPERENVSEQQQPETGGIADASEEKRKKAVLYQM